MSTHTESIVVDRPVRMVYGREESFFGHVRRHPARARVELGNEPLTPPTPCVPLSMGAVIFGVIFGLGQVPDPTTVGSDLSCQ